MSQLPKMGANRFAFLPPIRAQSTHPAAPQLTTRQSIWGSIIRVAIYKPMRCGEFAAAVKPEHFVVSTSMSTTHRKGLYFYEGRLSITQPADPYCHI